ncbi:hypothetical protein G5C51_39405 [Streptomyces sp. A7024]|uniref:Secreted protein n=1 Tax=Streptomyces coryli TaxID=1128680 RepID=A0A6G4UCR8_9ACTN|nr:hypothetical protein [Streptomyces coryli]NGN69943.1 hypothetical protein [Streptomyces coryli]
MNTTAKIAVFAGALAATFGGAYGVGQAVDPVSAEPEPKAAHDKEHGTQQPEQSGAHGGHGAAADTAPGGLAVSEGGYTLDLETRSLAAGEKQELRFAVRGEDGRPLTAYAKEHEKELHLILAARDFSTYRHLHPTRAADGTWSTPVKLPKAGDYRVFADFKPDKKGAEGLTLGADLAVGGTYRPAAIPEESATAKVDGYTVELDGALTPGAGAELKLSVEKNGKPVTNLQPYLGAYGHLVALRAGDLAYLHVHPNGEPGDGKTKPGPEISFTATAPSSGTYRLYLDFKHEGEVRTAAFTVKAGERAAGETGKETEKEAGHTDGHGH